MENNITGLGQTGTIPFSIRLCFQLLLLILIGFIIIQWQTLFVPLYFSILISILLLPFVQLLERIQFPKSLAAFTAILSLLALVVFVFYLVSAQIVSFFDDWPAIKIHVANHLLNIRQWIEWKFNLNTLQQNNYFSRATAGVKDAGGTYIKQTFFTISQVIVFVVFIFIYSFLILIYRSTIKTFILSVFRANNTVSVEAILIGSKQVIRKYMTGLLVEMAIVSSSNAILLSVIGIKYAIFLGLLTGILNVVPYVGIYTGIIITILITLTTTSGLNQLLEVLIGLLLIHLIDANVLMPKVIGTKVNINALMTIIGTVAGGLLLGVPGVFLALPTIAILKIVFDRMETMKPWGKLLEGSSEQPVKKIIKQLSKKLKKPVVKK